MTADAQILSSYGQQCSRAHCNTARCPPKAAFEHVTRDGGVTSHSLAKVLQVRFSDFRVQDRAVGRARTRQKHALAVSRPNTNENAT